MKSTSEAKYKTFSGYPDLYLTKVLHFENRLKAVEPINWSPQSRKWMSNFDDTNRLVDDDGNPFRPKRCDNSSIKFRARFNSGYGYWQSVSSPVKAVTGNDEFLRVKVISIVVL